MLRLTSITLENTLLLKIVLTKGCGQQSAWQDWQKEIIFDNLEADYLLIPSVYYALNKSGIAEGKYIGRMKGIYQKTWWQNNLIFNELQKILRNLNQANIPFLLLDDMAYAKYYYPDFAMRPIYEVSLYIPKAELKNISAILDAIGLVRLEKKYWQLLDGIRLHLKTDLGVDVAVEPFLSADYPVIDVTLQFWQTLTDFRPHPLLRLLDIGCLLQRHYDSLNWDKLSQWVSNRELNLPLIEILCYFENKMLMGISPQLIKLLKQNVTWSQKLEEHYHARKYIHPMAWIVWIYLKYKRKEIFLRSLESMLF